MALNFTVSEHALVRYLERVVGFDFAGYRDTLARRVAEACPKGSGSADLDGHVFVIENGRVVTVLPEGGRAKRKRGRR